MLAQALEVPEGRRFALDRLVTANAVGPLTADAIRPWLDEMPARQLAAHLIGGIAHSDLRNPPAGIFSSRPSATSSSSCRRSRTRYSSVTLLLDPQRRHLQPDVLARAREPETMIQRTIYKFNPMFAGGDFRI